MLNVSAAIQHCTSATPVPVSPLGPGKPGGPEGPVNGPGGGGVGVAVAVPSTDADMDGDVDGELATDGEVLGLAPRLPVTDGVSVSDGVTEAEDDGDEVVLNDGDGDGDRDANCSRRLVIEGVVRVTLAALSRSTTDSHPAVLRTRTPTATLPALLARDIGSTSPVAKDAALNPVREDVTVPSPDSVTNLKDRVSFPPSSSSTHPRVAKSNLIHVWFRNNTQSRLG
jgi:hypothetical protein